MNGSLPRPAVAIVLTCHNDAATLPETIASIADQETEIELVLVDDGSSDPATQRLLAELATDGLTVIRQENQGQAAATMTGFCATSAPYVMRFDSDDILLPGAIASLANALDESPRAAAAWGDVETFGLTSFRIPSVPAVDPWLVTYTNCIPGSGTLFRRTAVAEAGGWQLARSHSDWDLWMALAELRYSGVYVPGCVFRYRRDGSGQLAAWLPDTTDHYEELRRRHEELFATRSDNRRRSAAPPALKAAVTVVDAMPWLTRLQRIQLSELFTHLIWNGGVRMTSKMAIQAMATRLKRRMPGFNPLRRATAEGT
jgi:glycosyltransferase involved in cell wall biosynthesis